MFSDPQFWVFLAFVIFVGLIFNPVRKILLSNLDIKIEEIKKTIDEAEKLKNDAQLTLSEIKKRQNQVIEEIESIKNEAKKKIQLIEENEKIKLQEQMDKRNLIAKAKIEQMKRDANNEIKDYISKISMDSVVNILEKKLTKENKQIIIESSLKELNSALKN